MPNWDPNDEDHVGFAGPFSEERFPFSFHDTAEDKQAPVRRRTRVDALDVEPDFETEGDYAVEIEHVNDQIIVKSKYNDNLVKAWKMIPSRSWNREEWVTTFHISDKARVYAAMVLTIPGAQCLGPNGEFTVGGYPARNTYKDRNEFRKPKYRKPSNWNTDPSYYSDDEEGDSWHPGHPSNYGDR